MYTQPVTSIGSYMKSLLDILTPFDRPNAKQVALGHAHNYRCLYMILNQAESICIICWSLKMKTVSFLGVSVLKRTSYGFMIRVNLEGFRQTQSFDYGVPPAGFLCKMSYINHDSSKGSIWLHKTRNQPTGLIMTFFHPFASARSLRPKPS